jgi:serine/threonine protein kinase
MTPSQDLTPEDDDPFIGRVIAGNFRLDRLIGSGATGNVYQGEQLSLGKGVAVKILHPHLVGDDKLVKRFQREAKSASRLNHPNSVQIIESGQDGVGTLFIAMELLSGRDLAEVIRDEYPLPVPRIVHIMSQVFAALDEAHAHGLIHRDLKPSNIMLIERRNQTDFVKVCDYGIAKAAADEAATGNDSQMLTVQGLVCGTPEYMSPEQARGEVLDGRTDLYSAAVILYQMTTGDVPFRAATPIGIVSRHLSEAPIVPSTRRGDTAISAQLDDLIMRGLAKSRDLRPATAAIFRAELEQIGTPSAVDRKALANAPTLTATDPKPGDHTTASLSAQVPQVTGRSTRPLTMAMALLGVALLTAGGMAFLRRSGERRTPELAVQTTTTPLPAPAPAPLAATVAPLPVPQAAAPPEAPSNDDPTTAAADGKLDLKADTKSGNGHHKGPPPKNARATVGRASNNPRAGKPTDAPAAAPTPAAPHEAPAAVEPARPAINEEKVVPANPPRGTVAEAEKLLAQGEVTEACRRGEEVKKASPRGAPIYKFLGKCYMRAGKAALAKDNYRRYLELDPNAPDAVFIESIVK